MGPGPGVGNQDGVGPLVAEWGPASRSPAPGECQAPQWGLCAAAGAQGQRPGQEEAGWGGGSQQAAPTGHRWPRIPAALLQKYLDNYDLSIRVIYVLGTLGFSLGTAVMAMFANVYVAMVMISTMGVVSMSISYCPYALLGQYHDIKEVRGRRGRGGGRGPGAPHHQPRTRIRPGWLQSSGWFPSQPRTELCTCWGWGRGRRSRHDSPLGGALKWPGRGRSRARGPLPLPRLAPGAGASGASHGVAVWRSVAAWLPGSPHRPPGEGSSAQHCPVPRSHIGTATRQVTSILTARHLPQ